jgi:hypothetical protein
MGFRPRLSGPPKAERTPKGWEDQLLVAPVQAAEKPPWSPKVCVLVSRRDQKVSPWNWAISCGLAMRWKFPSWETHPVIPRWAPVNRTPINSSGGASLSCHHGETISLAFGKNMIKMTLEGSLAGKNHFSPYREWSEIWANRAVPTFSRQSFWEARKPVVIRCIFSIS